MEGVGLEMKILLINPRSHDDFIRDSGSIMLPNNLLILAGYGRTKGKDFCILDMNLDDEATLLSTLRNWLPDIVGITVKTGPLIKNAVEISKTVREILPKTKIVWGGVHPTMLPEQVLKDPFVDIVIIRDGEKTLVELADALSSDADISQVPGIAYRQGNTVRFSPPRQLFYNLDEVPDPAWDLVDIKRYTKDLRITLNTSRGCPFLCTFCYNKMMNDSRRAELSAKRVFDQICHLYKTYRVQYVDFLEDNFSANWQRVEEFCHLMIKSGISIKWTYEGRALDINRESIKLLKSAGCVSIRFGVESGSPKILKFIKKGITVEKVRQVFSECQEAGINTTMYLMMGIPNETDRDRKASLSLMDEFPNAAVELTTYRPYPGTDLFDYCIREGLFTPPNTTSEWASISDQYDPHFSVNKTSWRDIWKCQLHGLMHARKRILLSSRYSLYDILNYMIDTLPIRAEQLSFISHIPRHILVKPARFSVSLFHNILFCLVKWYKHYIHHENKVSK